MSIVIDPKQTPEQKQKLTEILSQPMPRDRVTALFANEAIKKCWPDIKVIPYIADKKPGIVVEFFPNSENVQKIMGIMADEFGILGIVTRESLMSSAPLQTVLTDIVTCIAGGSEKISDLNVSLEADSSWIPAEWLEKA